MASFQEFDVRNISGGSNGVTEEPAVGMFKRDIEWLNRPGRRIFCCDMDTFFVSVERLYDKSLIGKPVIVGGPKNARGIVAACSYEARAFGVKSGMSLWQASQLCPNGEFVHGRGHSYLEHSDRVRSILEEYLPNVRPASIDEFYCDVSGTEHIWRSMYELGHFLRREVYVRTGLPMTVGGGRNRLVSKVASSYAKPDGLYVVPEGGEVDFFAPMHVSKMPGIGPKTTIVLERHGIRTLGQLAKMPRNQLYTRFGRWGLYLWEHANGREVAIYQDKKTPVSIGHESTFRADVNDMAKVAEILRGLLERAGYRMRRLGLKCREVAVKLRYADFDTHTAQTGLPLTNVDRVIWPFALSLLGQLNRRQAAVRLVGIRLTDLHPDDGQLELFAPIMPAADKQDHSKSTEGDKDDAYEGNELGSENETASTGNVHRLVPIPAFAQGITSDLPFIDINDAAMREVARDSAWHDAVDSIRDRYGYEAIATGPTMQRYIERAKRKAGVGEAGGLEVERPFDKRVRI